MPLHPRELTLLSPRAVPKRRDDFARGRFVARQLLSRSLFIDPARCAVLPDAQGVPWAEDDVHGRLPISLSISHTAGLAAAAVVSLPCRVGIDVERPIEDAASIVRDYFTVMELRLVGEVELEERPWRAAEIWALKEAGMKSLGTGLRIPTTAVEVVGIAAEAHARGWCRVDIMLGAGAPKTRWPVRAWLCRHREVVVALSVLEEGGGSVSEPGPPIVFGPFTSPA
ncbi:MAG: 4'-phosphopantetheinyl transferase family protein [Myxococcota bacterium]